MSSSPPPGPTSVTSSGFEPSPAQDALLAAALAGDGEAFQDLVGPHLPELHAHCYRMLGSVFDADDVLQDVLVRAWRSLSTFAGRGPCAAGSTASPPIPA